MNATQIGQALVSMCNAGEEADFVDRCYAPEMVSIEGAGSEDMPARSEGLEAIREKHAWWHANNEVHASTAEGPYVGLSEDTFAVHFRVDVTPKGGERMQMNEIALYTVRDGRIVEERFLYGPG